MFPDPRSVVARLKDLQRQIRDAIVAARRTAAGLADVERVTSADTIYRLDLLIEPIVERFCDEWSRAVPMVVHCEGLEPETGRTFPAGLPEDRAVMRLLLDPIDGTRGLMYDKRSAWSLAGAAPNKGKETRLSDIRAAVMTELPTSKMAESDVLWAIRGQGAFGSRESLASSTRAPSPLVIRPSAAATLDHGFASIASFFPGIKELAAELMERVARAATDAGRSPDAAASRPTVFDDQYISTGGQLYELIVGHDRFTADLRPLFYRLQRRPAGFCCHPYDASTALVATEAGVILTDGLGGPLDAPFDLSANLAWAGYANQTLHDLIQPILSRYFETTDERR